MKLLNYIIELSAEKMLMRQRKQRIHNRKPYDVRGVLARLVGGEALCKGDDEGKGGVTYRSYFSLHILNNVINLCKM